MNIINGEPKEKEVNNPYAFTLQSIPPYLLPKYMK